MNKTSLILLMMGASFGCSSPVGASMSEALVSCTPWDSPELTFAVPASKGGYHVIVLWGKGLSGAEVTVPLVDDPDNVDASGVGNATWCPTPRRSSQCQPISVKVIMTPTDLVVGGELRARVFYQGSSRETKFRLISRGPCG
jgi:hypothetical protein